MGLTLEGKEETIIRNVLNFTLAELVNISLHTYEFSCRLTYSTKDIIQELFNAAPDSHIVKKYGRNYFYESLELLVHHVPKRK